jgi:hypothetical protein
MKQSGKFFPGWPVDDKDAHKAETTGHYVNLTGVDGQPHKERGYNPYDNGAKARDVWRHKPKRA